MLDRVKTIKGRFFIGIILVMVYISKIIYDLLWDLRIYVFNVPYTLLLIISILTNIIGITFLLDALKKLIKTDKINVRIGIIIFLCTGVVIVILPTGYYISYLLGLLYYGNAYIIFLVGRLFNYFYIMGIVLLLSSLILLVRKN